MLSLNSKRFNFHSSGKTFMVFRLWLALQSFSKVDYFPEFSAKVRRLVYNPCGVLVAFILMSLLCGTFIHPQGFIIGGGLLFVLILGLVLPWITLRGTFSKVIFSKNRAFEGDSVETKLVVKNYFPWPTVGLTAQVDKGLFSRMGFSLIPARNSVVTCWEWQPEKRGVYPQKISKISTGFPFGLWENSKPIKSDNELLVWPRIFPVGPVPLSGGEHRVDGNVSRRKIGTHGDIVGVRPYRRGDSPKRIHWAQSAKHDRLVVCELESCSRPSIQLIIDVNPDVHSNLAGNDTFEWSLRIAASFAKGWLSEGADVGIGWSGFELPPSSGAKQEKNILDALATCQMGKSKSLEQIISCQSCSHLRDGLKIIITTDLVHLHGSCVSCEKEEYRWIILDVDGFKGSSGGDKCIACPKPWLQIMNPDDLKKKLLGGWKEAIHGT